jgi:hypothetical protein
VIGAVVDWDAILEVVWVSLAAGVGVTAAWAFALLGATRSVEHSRDGRTAGAVVYAGVGVVAATAVVAGIVYGIVILTGD